MAELVDAHDSNSCSARSVGSIPTSGTKRESVERLSLFFVFKRCNDAAVTFGVVFNVPNHAISNAIRAYTPTNNRSQIKKTILNTLLSGYSVKTTRTAQTL